MKELFIEALKEAGYFLDMDAMAMAKQIMDEAGDDADYYAIINAASNGDWAFNTDSDYAEFYRNNLRAVDRVAFEGSISVVDAINQVRSQKAYAIAECMAQKIDNRVPWFAE